MPVLTITTSQIPWLIAAAIAILAAGVVIGLLSGDAARTRRLHATPTPPAPAPARPERAGGGRHARPHGLHRHHDADSTGEAR